MAKQILTKWIGDDQVIDSKILLRNTEWLRGRNASDTGNLNLIGVNLLDETISYSDFIPRSGFNSSDETFIDNEDASPAASDIYLTESSFFSAQDGFGSTEIATGFMVPFNGDIQTLDMFLDNAVGNGYEYFSNIPLGISGGGGLSGIVAMPFVVSSTIDATKVFLRIRNFGGAVGLFTMRVFGDVAGEPDETNVIDTVSIAATGVPGSFSDVEFPFASPLNLTPGTYYITLNSADDDNSALAIEVYGGVQSAFVSGDGGSTWNPATPIGMMIFAQGAPGDLSVIIYNDNAGEPGSMVGQSDPILRDSILAPGFVTFTFSTPAVVSGSTMYWAALVGDATYQSAESATIIGRRDADQSLYPTKIFTGTWVDPTVMTASLRFSVFGEQQTPVTVDLGKDAAPWDKVYQKESRFMDEDNSNYVGFKAPTTVSSDQIWILPAADGAAGQALTTDGSGNLSWASTSPGGVNTNVQYNNSGAFGGSNLFTWNNSIGSLRLNMTSGGENVLIISDDSNNIGSRNIKFEDGNFPLMNGYVSAAGVSGGGTFSAATQFEFIFGTTQTHPTYGKTAWFTANQRIFSVSGGGSPELSFQKHIHLNGQNELRFQDSDSSNYVAFRAPATVGTNLLWTLPDVDGAAGTALVTDGAGTLSWANPGVSWKKYTVSHTALQTAALTNDIELFSLPAGGVIHNAIIKHSASFTGGSIATYTLSVGIAANLTKYASAFDVFQAPGGGVGQTSSVVDFEDTGAATSIRLAAVSTGDNLDQSATGSVDVWVLWGALP